MSYIDLHNHCIPALDDGVKNEEESLVMLQCAVKSDIKVMFVTPHRAPKGRFNPDNDEVIKACRRLRRLANANQLKIGIRYGEEFRIKTDSIDLIQSDQVLGYSGTDYVLAEFTRTNAFSKLIPQAIEAFHLRGKKVLIAHPERYFDDVNEGVEACRSWVEMGCFLQINRTSLLGVHGIYAEKIAHKLIKLGLAHVIASDAHEGEGIRVCRLDDIYFIVKKKYGPAIADMLFHTNPEHLINNVPMVPILRPKRHLKLFSYFVAKKKPKKEIKEG
jgi:protein-tyrosine phosphatase